MERRRFTREFKLEAVRLIRDRGVSYAQASQDLKVHPTQLRNWVKAFAVRIVRQKVEALAPHLAAVATVEPAHLKFQEIRVSPHDRSRTRQTLRSYQSTCMRPQQPHAVFLTAD